MRTTMHHDVLQVDAAKVGEKGKMGAEREGDLNRSESVERSEDVKKKEKRGAEEEMLLNTPEWTAAE